MKKKRTKKPFRWDEAHQVLEVCMTRKEYDLALTIALGMYTGYRVAELIKIKYEDITEKKEITLIEDKTRKVRTIDVPPRLVEIVAEIQKKKGRRGNENILENSRYDSTRSTYASEKKISKNAVISRIKKAFKLAGITSDATGHTLRKTWALRTYEVLKRTHGDYLALDYVSKSLNHARLDTTRRYINLTEKEIKNSQANIDAPHI